MKQTKTIKKKGWTNTKALLSSLCCTLAIGSCLYACDYYRPKQVTTSKKPKSTPISTQEAVETVGYLPLSLSAESFEKDLTVYFNDENGNPITDKAFQIKLISNEDASNLETYKTQLSEINQKITDLETVSPEASEETSEVVEPTPTTEETINSLTLEKEKVVEEYTKALVSIDGTLLTDDDLDGTIYQNELESGDFTLCYIPNESYDPSEYTSAVTIKDQADYAEVEVQTVAYNSADDAHSNNTTVEATITDTVSYVDSRSETIYEPSNKTSSVSSYQSDNTVVLYTTSSANSYTVNTNMNITDYAVNGDVSVTSNGTSFTVTTNGSTSTSATVTVTSSNDETQPTQSGYSIIVKGVDCSDSINAADGTVLYNQDGSLYTVGNYLSGSPSYTPTTKYYGWQTLDGTKYYFDSNGNKVTGTQTISGTTYNFGNDGSLLLNGTGIDVSSWQGSIDWSTASQYVSFTIVRVGYRGYMTGKIAEDPYARNNITSAKANGLKVGIYFYTLAKTQAQAVEEASFAISIARACGGTSLPIYIDIEDYRLQDGLTNTDRTNIVNAFCKTVQNAGYSAGVYANKYWLTSLLNPSQFTSGVHVWCAQYYTSCTYKGNYDIWQYTSSGSIPGISGNVDMNKSYFG